MGCFLGCFGASKEGKRRKNPNVGHQYQYQLDEPIRPNVVAKVEIPDKPLYVPSESEFGVKPEEKQLSSIKDFVSSKPEEKQLSSGSHKKVTFDSNVKEYEHVSADEAPEIIQETEKEVEKKETHETSKVPPSKSLSISDGGSTLSSLGSFPPNHRYQNCRESDDEEEELDCELSDVDKDVDLLGENDDDDVQDDEYSDDDDDDDVQELSPWSCSSMESRTRPDSETKTPEFNRAAARDRAGYVHSVLNPVENTTQWKVVKAKGTPPLKNHQKENVPAHSSKSNYEQVAVDASLANWLGSSEKTPPAKKTTIGLEPIASGGASASSSHGSNSVKSRDERPILGAYSTRRSPDAKQLIETVGEHWSVETPIEEDSGSASSFKGIPNTTSKYSEDKRVNWHSTPFETRLERALNKGAGRGLS